MSADAPPPGATAEPAAPPVKKRRRRRRKPRADGEGAPAAGDTVPRESRDLAAELNAAADLVAEAMLADRHRLRGQLRGLRRQAKEGRPVDRNLDRLTRQLDRSVALRAERAKSVPAITYPAELPVSERSGEIAAAIRDHQVVVLCGETGSGKSTQLPKICLELGRGVGGTIGHTQPRRIAARSVAARVADELGVPVGRQVGFKVRFGDETTDHTLVKLMTDGILLAETQSDRFLERYDTIIIDEAHERSLNIDFLLGYIKRLLPKRSDLRVVVTSATIDVARYAEFFSSTDADGETVPAPVIEVAGRTYPVEMRYRPPGWYGPEGEDPESVDPQEHLAAAIEEVCREGPGDVLAFVPTEREIREAAKTLRGRRMPGSAHGTEILPLYGRLSPKDQAKVFQPHPGRRIVIATNVAESSLTVPNIRSVVDTGTARISRYSARSGVQRLPIESVSQASANQRAGRCGRVGPGVCIRLYSEEDYESRELFTPPEIQRTNLAGVILQMKALGLGELEDFPLLEPPRPGAIRDGLATLFEVGAIDGENALTGRRPHLGEDAGRPPHRPDRAGRGGGGVPGRGAADRRGAGDPGPPRPADREAPAGGRGPREVPARGERLPGAAERVGLLS